MLCSGFESRRSNQCDFSDSGSAWSRARASGARDRRFESFLSDQRSREEHQDVHSSDKGKAAGANPATATICGCGPAATASRCQRGNRGCESRQPHQLRPGRWTVDGLLSRRLRVRILLGVPYPRRWTVRGFLNLLMSVRIQPGVPRSTNGGVIKLKQEYFNDK